MLLEEHKCGLRSLFIWNGSQLAIRNNILKFDYSFGLLTSYALSTLASDLKETKLYNSLTS